jgi:hypothetical protein
VPRDALVVVVAAEPEAAPDPELDAVAACDAVAEPVCTAVQTTCAVPAHSDWQRATRSARQVA